MYRTNGMYIVISDFGRSVIALNSLEYHIVAHIIIYSFLFRCVLVTDLRSCNIKYFSQHKDPANIVSGYKCFKQRNLLIFFKL